MSVRAHLQRYFEVDNSEHLVNFSEALPKENRPNVAEAVGLVPNTFTHIKNRPFTMFKAAAAHAPAPNEAINHSSPAYVSKHNPNQHLVLLPEVVIAGSDELLERAANIVNGTIRKGPFYEPGDSVTIVLQPGTDVLDAVERLENEGYSAMPNALRKFKKTLARNEEAAGSSEHDREWYQVITETTEAWNRGYTGNKSIKIAIIDEGVDMKHKDLADILTDPFDAIKNDKDPSPDRNDAHGTCCAGLAAAIHNTFGARGIGSGCLVVPIRIAYSDPNDERIWITDDASISAAFDHARKVGAQIISNSWGGGDYQGYAAALNRALKANCIVLAAAGNDSLPVDYPGKYPGVICVSASTNLDSAKRENDGSWEPDWGTNYGPEVWIAAPGVRMFTTDISGSRGYNKRKGEAGDYDSAFNGTSSATPVVAGAVGLMLSQNPKLTPDQVKNILRDTADKAGTDPYNSKGRNDYMGYGRLNVLQAVEAAIALR